MTHKIHVRPLGWLARTVDVLMVPLMYLMAGTFSEVPQRTHRWNNSKLSMKATKDLSNTYAVTCIGDDRAVGRNGLLDLRFHLPIIGGWKKYVVLCPLDVNQDWYIGWMSTIDAGVSRIKLRGPVRMLLGPGEVTFFGLNAETNEQVNIQETGRGRIGDKGPHAQVPLL